MPEMEVRKPARSGGEVVAVIALMAVDIVALIGVIALGGAQLIPDNVMMNGVYAFLVVLVILVVAIIGLKYFSSGI